MTTLRRALNNPQLQESLLRSRATQGSPGQAIRSDAAPVSQAVAQEVEKRERAKERGASRKYRETALDMQKEQRQREKSLNRRKRKHADKQALIDAPFTRIHPQGIRGVFTPREIEEILEFIEGLAA